MNCKDCHIEMELQNGNYCDDCFESNRFQYLMKELDNSTECHICHAKVRKDKKLNYQGKTCHECDKRIDEIYAKVEEESIKKMKEQKRKYENEFKSCPCGRTNGDGYCNCYDY